MKLLAAHNRQPIVYDAEMHRHKCIYFPGREKLHIASYVSWDLSLVCPE
jgi:hypothetical protein